ncbi:hypothetical protein BKA65DRAFT_414213, partial [Rhexocercosporidium sp. MPI-PUGE-AT-0058]
FFKNCPLALLKLRYRDIIVTLLRDPNSGPYRILIKFIYEFTNSCFSYVSLLIVFYLNFTYIYFNIKFVFLKIIFDPSLILSLYVFLLGFIFIDTAFTALNLRYAL